MATVPKAQKEKSHGGAPKLVPRPTAASAARAARIATNRNLAMPATQQRQSPPNTAKIKKRIPTKTDSKSSVREGTQELTNEESPRSDDIVLGLTDVFCDTLEDQTLPIDPGLFIPKIEEVTDEKEGKSGQPESERSCEIKSCPSTPRSVQSSRPTTPRVANQSNQPTTPQAPSSRPTTPQLPTSRPTTPQPPSSRPTTPKMSSRPTTPQVSLSSRATARPVTPCSNTLRSCASSRPTTPMISSQSQLSRTKTPDQSSHIITSSVNLNKEDGDNKLALATKQKQFNRLKKELDLKQHEVLLMFDSLRQARERIVVEGESGAGEGQVEEELVMFNVADWTAAEVAQMLHDASPSIEALEFVNNIDKLGDSASTDLDMKVMSVPSTFAELCLKAFTTRAELIDWVKELISQQEDGGGESNERISQYNAEGLELCEMLQNLKEQATVSVKTFIQLSRQAYQERAALATVGQTLVRELAKLREDLNKKHAAIEDINDSTISKQLSETRRDSEEERAAQKVLKEKLATTEQQVRQARARMAKMDRQLREADASILTLTNTVKSLEEQSRQKEVQLEARARKLRESLKSGEFTSQQIAQQRDTFQVESAQLKQQIEKLVADHKCQVQDLNSKLKEYSTSLGHQIKATEKEIEAKLKAESALEESQREIEQLNAKISELIKSRPNPDLPTEREMELWAELTATKETLRMTEDEVMASKREKVRFLETLTKIAETDNKIGMQQKLAAELLSKEEVVSKMQIQMREMSRTIKINEQKLQQYEQYVHSLQEYTKNVSQETEDQQVYHYQNLEQEIMSLKMNLLEVVHRNEELSELLGQKDQQLDHQEKTSRAQAKVIKVREELINMLKNKETEQSLELSSMQQDLEHRMRVVEEVNKQIASKADEIQELFATLESKQQQIHRLEKIVLALEEQHCRAQAQRTRHEEKIATLEHELASISNRRERKFIFF